MESHLESRPGTAAALRRAPARASVIPAASNSLQTRLQRMWVSPVARDRVYASGAGALVVVVALSLHSAGALDAAFGTSQASLFVAGLTALAGVAGSGTWYAWRRERSTSKELAAFRREDEERRAITAIGVGASWDLDPRRGFTRFSNDLRQLLEYDRLALTSAKHDGRTELLFVQGEHAKAGKIGSTIPPGWPEPDDVGNPAALGFQSKLTVPFLAINGTITLRSKKAGAYAKHEMDLLRQVVAQATPGVANALLYEASQRQLNERTALAEIGRAATGTPDLREIFPIVRKALGALIRFDHIGVVLSSPETGKGKAAYWLAEGLLGLKAGDELDFDRSASGPEVSVGRWASALPSTPKDGGSPPGEARLWLQAPLKVQDNVLGMLFLSTVGEDWVGDDESLLVEQVSLQVAPAIRNAQLLAAERALKQELDSQYRELKEAQEAKNRFLSAVSHELRTPLAIISGFVDLLRSDPGGNLTTEQVDTLTIMSRNSRQLEHLIGDLLDISRIGASKFQINPTLFNGSEMLRAVIEDTQGLMAGKAQVLTSSLPDGQVWLNADSGRVSQLVTNFLTNASKYSNARTKIVLKASWDTKDLHVSVKDQGIGMSREDQEKLFTAFYRVDNQVTRMVPGTGLGLYISKTIAEMHGGRIWLESKAGEGTTVHFTIPCVAGPPAAREEPGEQLNMPRSRLYPEQEMDEIPIPAV